jgi:hypothetical protein
MLIDISEVRTLQEQRIEMDIDAARKEKLDSLVQADQLRREKLEKAEKSRKHAEENFPTMIADVAQKIKDAVDNGRTSLKLGIPDGNAGWYTAIMLFQVLPLHGLLGKIDGNSITISW